MTGAAFLQRIPMPIDVESVISLYAKEAAACYGSELVSQLEYVGLAGA
jgi:hypothetical protein